MVFSGDFKQAIVFSLLLHISALVTFAHFFAHDSSLGRDDAVMVSIASSINVQGREDARAAEELEQAQRSIEAQAQKPPAIKQQVKTNKVEQNSTLKAQYRKAQSQSEQKSDSSIGSGNRLADQVSDEVGDGGSGAGERARILSAPRPEYPIRARQIGFEGKVDLAVKIAADGSVEQVDVIESSGREDCDQSALSTLLHRWRFAPAVLKGEPITSREVVVVRFQLRG